MKNIYFKHTIPIYDVAVRICFDKDSASKASGLELGDCVGAVYKDYDSRLFVIYVKDEDVLDMNTVAHESFHLTGDIMSYIGGDFMHDTANEHYAYLLGYITDMVLNFHKKYKEQL